MPLPVDINRYQMAACLLDSVDRYCTTMKQALGIISSQVQAGAWRVHKTSCNTTICIQYGENNWETFYISAAQNSSDSKTKVYEWHGAFRITI